MLIALNKCNRGGGPPGSCCIVFDRLTGFFPRLQNRVDPLPGGFNLVARGGRYNGVCDVELEEEFLDAYRIGRQLYTLRSNVNDANSQIYSRERDIEHAKSLIRDTEVELISDETETQRRLILLVDLKDLSEQIGQLESEIGVLIDDRARHEYELRAFEATIAGYGY